MTLPVIPLDSDDDIISICDRLDWLDESRLLLVLPADGGVLREGLDLVRLRRHADRRRVEVGLVTADIAIRQQARALGFPVFATTTAGDAASQRRWRQGKRRRERVGLPTMGGQSGIGGLAQWRPQPLVAADRSEVHRRLRPHLAMLHRWLWRYAAIFFFFITLSLLVVAFLYVVPQATITLQPATQPVSATRLILADPTLTAVDYAHNAVPARILRVSHTWQTDVTTSGTVDVPNAAARGLVVFVNLLEQEVEIPAGTRVSTSAGTGGVATAGGNVTFQTLTAVTLAGVPGSTVEVDVMAVEPGPQGNVAANLVNRVAGTLATRVEVRNLEPMTGGAVRAAAAVSLADQTRLRAQVLQYLQALALSEMEAQLTREEFLAPDSLRVDQIDSETFSHFPGEQTEKLALEMRAALVGTAVNTHEAAGLLYESVVTAVPPHHTLVPDSLVFTVGDVVGVDEAGRVTFEMHVTGLAAADLSTVQHRDAPLTVITGQPPDLVAAYLYAQLPLQAVPVLDIWPTWFQRLPYLPARIQVDIQTKE